MRYAIAVLALLGLAGLALADDPAGSSWGWAYKWQDDEIHLATVYFPFEGSEPGKAVPLAIARSWWTPSKVLTVDWIVGTTEGPEFEGWVGLGVTFHPPAVERLLSSAFALVGLEDDLNIRFDLAVAQIGDDTEFGLYMTVQLRLLEF